MRIDCHLSHDEQLVSFSGKPVGPTVAMKPLDSPQLVDAYDRLLANVGRVATEVENGRLTSHWPLVGRNFDHGVLVVGQAVYGWIPDWTAADATTAAGRMAILDDTKATFSDLDDPMSWIGEHRVENSPFWRTVHEVTDVVSPDLDGPWFSRVAWANLGLGPFVRGNIRPRWAIPSYSCGSGLPPSGTLQPRNSQPRMCGAPSPGVQLGQPQGVRPPSSGRKARSHVFSNGSQYRP